MSVARFDVFWRFDGTTRGTVEIDRGARTFTVRPFRRRSAYTLPLADVAEFVAVRICATNAQRARAEKLQRRRGAR